MDRFTTSDGNVVGFKGDMDKLADALLRLSKYEDTGLLPEEIAELQKKVAGMDISIDYLLNRITDRLDKEVIAFKSENAFLKAEAVKAEKKIFALKKQIEGLLARKQDDSNLDRFLESLNGAINCSEARFVVNPVNDTPDPAANPTPKKKRIAWEAD